MPSSKTFTIPPIRDFVKLWIFRHAGLQALVDPFAGSWRPVWPGAVYTNDLDPESVASSHFEARDFLGILVRQGVVADVVILDPPYSPRQIAEVYKGIGRPVGMVDTQSAKLKKECKDMIQQITRPGSFVLSFGWNTSGMGVARGWVQREIMIVDHGGDHNSTLCLAEERR